MMSEKVSNEFESQKVVQFNEWCDSAETELLELLSLSSDLDPELYEIALKRAPLIMKETKKMRKNARKNAKMAMKLSRSTKKYYLKVSKSIVKLIKNDEVTDDLKAELVALLKEISFKVERADERDKQFFSEQQSKTVGYSALALLAVAALYGVKAIKKD